MGSDAMRQAYRCGEDVKASLARHAEVVVASCIGAHSLIEAEAGPFELVVLDEAAQTTEPALCCALAAAKAEQVVFFGDTRQLPPTVVSGDRELRYELGRSPMERLERSGVEKQTLHVQYRMPPALVEFPSKHFYRGVVQSSVSRVRTALRRVGVEGVRVGSVDSFQGQEADIVVFSATRGASTWRSRAPSEVSWSWETR